jgi:hypothetical protein
MAAKAGVPPSSATRPPALADEDDGRHVADGDAGGGRLWILEPGQPTTWHIVSERIAYHWYRMACGWELRLADAAGMWPTKDDEPQPPTSARCRSCVQMHEVMMVLGGPSFGLGAQRAVNRA